MLLTNLEVAQFPLNKRAVDNYTAQVINTLNGIENPCKRYAIARCLKNIFDKAVEEVGAAMEAYCEKNNIGSDGCEFNLGDITKDPADDGVMLMRQFNMDYNYAANATDEEGDLVPYTEHVKQLERTQRALKARRAMVNADKELIEAAHPNMKPELINVVVKLNWIPD